MPRNQEGFLQPIKHGISFLENCLKKLDLGSRSATLQSLTIVNPYLKMCRLQFTETSEPSAIITEWGLILSSVLNWSP